MATMTKTSDVSSALRSGKDFTSAAGSRALVNAAETWFSTATECHREMIGFVSMRIEKDSEIFREMMDCKNLTDVTAIQSRWMEDTLRDYNTEMTKLMTIYTKSANGGGRIER